MVATRPILQRMGKPYPWTAMALRAAKEYTDQTKALSLEDKADLTQSFDDLTMDTPRTPVAASRFKRILGSASGSKGDPDQDTRRSHETGGEGPSWNQGLPRRRLNFPPVPLRLCPEEHHITHYRLLVERLGPNADQCHEARAGAVNTWLLGCWRRSPISDPCSASVLMISV
jgi:hypothetical protein